MNQLALPLEALKCLLGVVYPLVPCTLTAATLNWYQRPGRISASHTRSSEVYIKNPGFSTTHRRYSVMLYL